MSEILQTARQLHILQILSESHSGLTISEIHAKVGQKYGDVSQRTIRRDIDQLSSEYNIQEVQLSLPTRYNISKFNIKQLQLTVEDLYSLTMTQALLKEHMMDNT